MGDNQYGQLGDGTFVRSTNRPELIVASNITAIAAEGPTLAPVNLRGGHSLFIKTDGSLWAMGNNDSGQLGDGTFNNTNRPEIIVSSGVMGIAAAGNQYQFFPIRFPGRSYFLKRDGSLWAMGDNSSGAFGDGTFHSTNRPEQILAAYNQISGQLVGWTNVQLSFVGIANANYALDRTFNLSPPNWIPQATNAAGSFGALVFTNTPDPTTNNFWRIRSVP